MYYESKEEKDARIAKQEAERSFFDLPFITPSNKENTGYRVNWGGKAERLEKMLHPERKSNSNLSPQWRAAETGKAICEQHLVAVSRTICQYPDMEFEIAHGVSFLRHIPQKLWKRVFQPGVDGNRTLLTLSPQYCSNEDIPILPPLYYMRQLYKYAAVGFQFNLAMKVQDGIGLTDVAAFEKLFRMRRTNTMTYSEYVRGARLLFGSPN